jgi:hypothetical protein
MNYSIFGICVYDNFGNIKYEDDEVEENDEVEKDCIFGKGIRTLYGSFPDKKIEEVSEDIQEITPSYDVDLSKYEYEEFDNPRRIRYTNMYGTYYILIDSTIKNTIKEFMYRPSKFIWTVFFSTRNITIGSFLEFVKFITDFYVLNADGTYLFDISNIFIKDHFTGNIYKYITNVQKDNFKKFVFKIKYGFFLSPNNNIILGVDSTFVISFNEGNLLKYMKLNLPDNL